MHVVIGGAYSGKRSFVRKLVPSAEWISAYNGQMITDEAKFDEALVLEGFEDWILHLLQEGKSDKEICAYILNCLSKKKEKHDLYIIMLEVGRGIVPIEQHQRRLRDIMGWIQQSAVQQAVRATYIWHGLAHEMKKQASV